MKVFMLYGMLMALLCAATVGTAAANGLPLYVAVYYTSSTCNIASTSMVGVMYTDVCAKSGAFYLKYNCSDMELPTSTYYSDQNCAQPLQTSPTNLSCTAGGSGLFVESKCVTSLSETFYGAGVKGTITYNDATCQVPVGVVITTTSTKCNFDVSGTSSNYTFCNGTHNLLYSCGADCNTDCQLASETLVNTTCTSGRTTEACFSGGVAPAFMQPVAEPVEQVPMEAPVVAAPAEPAVDAPMGAPVTNNIAAPIAAPSTATAPSPSALVSAPVDAPSAAARTLIGSTGLILMIFAIAAMC